jgi:hypothetical protein
VRALFARQRGLMDNHFSLRDLGCEVRAKDFDGSRDRFEGVNTDTSLDSLEGLQQLDQRPTLTPTSTATAVLVVRLAPTTAAY